MTSLKRLSITIVGALFLVVAAAYVYQFFTHETSREEAFFSEARIRDQSSSDESFPSFANCENPAQGSISFSAEMYVHEEFFDHLALDKDVSNAIERHLRYLNGFYNSSKRDGIRGHLLGRPRFQIEKTERVTYGQVLDFDFVKDDHRLYPKRFLGKTRVEKTELARKITYSAEQGIVLCSGGSAMPPDKLMIALPRDPYLAFWSVKESERRPLAFHRHKAVTNFCARPQVADLSEPSMYWYVWNPFARGKDENGAEFDCSQVLQEGADYFTTEAKFKRHELHRETIGFDEVLKIQEWRASIVFGFVREGDSKKAFGALKPFIENKSVTELQGIDEKIVGDVDPSFHALLRFLKGIEDISDIQSGRVKTLDGHFEVEMETRLKSSGRKLKYAIYFGPTGEWRGAELHWPFIKSALDSAQFIFFVGHSELGQGMDFLNLKTRAALSNTEITTSVSKQKYQMLGIISCYSMYYFGSDYLQLRKAPDRITDLLLVGSEQYLFALPLAYFSYLDSKAAGANVSLRKAMALLLKEDEAVYVSRQI